ncbi:MAG: LemA family protein [Candidatus Eisenbacteria bacterium]|uniref:LemA family protein n=1 Tax=Eiseniibacteriota bacterium TaxID=2212470 RepID=A0A948RYE2_UNCEI|nr:LemA family protein [Candidatus Eisenbacteria bacterium]MBU2693303.1 LemA family protein [Candidatus Eisenbacteria bacterium]
MGRGAIIGLVILGILIVLGLSVGGWVKTTYNGLVGLDETSKTAWSEVENQFQRRYDLIPNLVETVKGYAQHEQDVFVKVTEARSKVAGAGTVEEKINANQELSGALARLMVVVERYPDLKANENFIRLQDELAGTENRIATARRRYNETARDLNIKIRTFPANIIAGMFGFERATLFETTEDAKEAPKVKFTGEGQ